MFNLRDREGAGSATTGLSPLDTQPPEADRPELILRAVIYAAERFQQPPAWEDAALDVLARLGEAALVSRVSIFEVDVTLETGPSAGRRFEWVAPGVPPLRETGSGLWGELLARGEPIHAHTRDLPPGQRAELESQGICSMVVVPVPSGSSWWGFMGFDDCIAEREWSYTEIGALEATASLLGAAIQRDRASRVTAAMEEPYRRLVELSPDAIAVHSEGRLVFANLAAAKLWGAVTPKDLIGKTVEELVHPDHWAIVQERALQQVSGQESPLREIKYLRLDGRVIDVEVAGTPLMYDGKPSGQIVVRDITERKRAEVALHQRNVYLDALHDTSLALMNRLDLKEVLQAIVARAAGLVGTEHGYMYLLRPDDDEIEMTVGLGAFARRVGFRMKRGEGMAGKVLDSEQPIVVDDYDSWPGRSPVIPKGTFRSAVGMPLKSGRQVVGILGLAHVEEGMGFTEEEVELLKRFAGLASIAFDNARLYTSARKRLTEKSKAERQLRATEQKYRTLVEQIPAITYTDLADNPMTTVFISPQVEALLGFTPEEYCQDPDLWYKHLHPDDRAGALATYLRGRQSGKPFSFEYRMIARDGREVWFRDDAIVLPDESGRPSLIHGVMFDITQRKRMEEELERALRTERDAAERLRALDELKNTFLHAVSHELRTPLSAVLGFALTLERQEVELSNEERLEITRRLAASARKLDQLLADLLDLDRLDRGILEPHRRPTDMAGLLRRTIEGSDIVGDRPVRVEANPVVVAVDAPKVERILENLLANAVKHTPPGTPIWIRVAPEDAGVLITVEDEGPGVPEELRDSVFEPFQRGPDAPRHSPGVGIGLSLVSRFAELHGGRAWVTERAGGGASFRVYLPG